MIGFEIPLLELPRPSPESPILSGFYYTLQSKNKLLNK
jgi:hypothetical protein